MTTDQILHQIVDANVAEAVDQAAEFGGLANALDSYRCNLGDTLEEKGITGIDRELAFIYFQRASDEVLP